MENCLHSDLTYKIIGCAMEVHKELGAGFLEKVYENALMLAFKEEGILAETQKPLKVKFHGIIVGDYCADIIVEDKILLEIKAVKAIVPEHRAQIINYLTATGIKVGLLINFGSKSLEHERFIK